jgi:hypothetical protein
MKNIPYKTACTNGLPDDEHMMFKTRRRHEELNYVGESKIIRTIGTCFAAGCTAGWACQNTRGLLLSYHCGAGVILMIHFCHKFFAINMDTPNFICIKKEQRAVIHFCGLKVY